MPVPDIKPFTNWCSKQPWCQTLQVLQAGPGLQAGSCELSRYVGSCLPGLSKVTGRLHVFPMLGFNAETIRCSDCCRKILRATTQLAQGQDSPKQLNSS